MGALAAPCRFAPVPRVSVVIPCYNYGRYLPQCVYSVSRNQPGIELEIIIVDDASTDSSADVARQLAAEDDRIILIRHAANAGHIATYNDGLSAATGDYVLLLSADDLATPGALTRAVALFEAEPSVGLVYGRAIDFSGTPPSPRTDPSRWVVWSGVDWLRERCRIGFNVAASPEVMMRMSVLRDIGLYSRELPHAGDFEMWLRTACVSGVGFLLGVDQAFYRKHPQNMHLQQFSAATHRGQLIDLRQRWQSFGMVFDGTGGDLEERDELRAIARRTLRRQAHDLVTYARARGFPDFPYDDFACFISELDGRRRTGARFRARETRAGIGAPAAAQPLLGALGHRLAAPGRRPALAPARSGHLMPPIQTFTGCAARSGRGLGNSGRRRSVARSPCLRRGTGRDRCGECDDGRKSEGT